MEHACEMLKPMLAAPAPAAQGHLLLCGQPHARLPRSTEVALAEVDAARLCRQALALTESLIAQIAQSREHGFDGLQMAAWAGRAGCLWAHDADQAAAAAAQARAPIQDALASGPVAEAFIDSWLHRKPVRRELGLPASAALPDTRLPAPPSLA